MKQFISGRELIQKSGVQEFEIIRLIKAGIRPYDNCGRKISISDLGFEISKYCEELYDARGKIACGVISPPSVHMSPEEFALTLEDTCTELEKFRNSMYARGWENLELPPYNDLAQEILSILVDALYRISDIPDSISLEADGIGVIDGKDGRKIGSLQKRINTFPEILKTMVYAVELCMNKAQEGLKVTREELEKALKKRKPNMETAEFEQIRTAIDEAFPGRFLKGPGRPKKTEEEC